MKETTNNSTNKLIKVVKTIINHVKIPMNKKETQIETSSDKIIYKCR